MPRWVWLNSVHSIRSQIKYALSAFKWRLLWVELPKTDGKTDGLRGQVRVDLIASFTQAMRTEWRVGMPHENHQKRAARNGVVITDRFLFFLNGWPSQWYGSRFVIDGMSYGCCEQFMMAEKARIFNDQDALDQVMTTQDPKTQKAIGRRIRGFEQDAWNSFCRGIVYRGNLAKFTQNDELQALLIATGIREIVEASPGDRIWGIGLSADHPDACHPSRWKGTNWLGTAIMQIRAKIVSGQEPPKEIQVQLNRRSAFP